MSMKNLINRSRGEILCTISDQDFFAIAKRFVRQSESSSGYYLNSESLKLLDDIGISESVLVALRSHMEVGGLDLGWEEQTLPGGAVFHGRTLDSLDEPVGGIRVVLLSSGHKVLNWSYSRPDGSYSVSCPPDVAPNHIRFAGRGDLILNEFVVNGDGDQGETQIDTLSGQVVSKEGEPIPYVSVQLLKWREGHRSDYHGQGSKGGGSTWGDTNENGQFVVPILITDDSKSWQGILEILAPKGQTLRKLEVTIHPNESLDLGHLVCPKPDDEWGGEPVEPKRSVVMYPGVSERPLS